ncbi:MAG: MFS transporter [Candidatus Hodarchaeales archaeon]|jgi:UMF1 family MFS transporter
MVDDTKSILSWSLYDWANSAFATTVMAGFFPLFLNNYWALGNEITSTFYLGVSNSLASIIVAFLAPVLGAIADKMQGKKKFLLFFAFLGIIMTGGLRFVEAGMWQFAIFLYIIASVGFSGANTFYDSLLPGVASERKIHFTSSLGFSLGYIGGGLLFVLNVAMYLMPAAFGIPDGETAIKLAFLTVAIWWAVFSIPIFLFVKEPEVTEKKIGYSGAVKAGIHQLIETLKDIRHLKWVALFLLGYWFYIDGVDTIIRMAVDYGTNLGFSSTALIVALLITQFVAFPATLAYNFIAQKITQRNAVLIAIIAYGIITILGYFMVEEWHFYALAIMVGCFQGGIQALSRSLYSRIIPKNKAAQFYGFFNMLGKFAAVIGPFMMGSITLVTGDIRFGILSILILFLFGGFIFARVDFDAGEKMADEFLG